MEGRKKVENLFAIIIYNKIK